MVVIGDALVQNNKQARGAAGLAWLKRLPEIVADLEGRWAITVGPPFPRLSFNYAAPALRADGRHAVLKLGFPGDPELVSEIEALRLLDGRGVSRLLEVDAWRGAMLLERLEPGVPLHTLRDERREVAVAASIMKRLWRTVPDDHPFPTVTGWGRAFDRHRREHGGTSGPLPDAIFARGEALYRELDTSTERHVLLHGDLHHDNILSARREPWLAIDPKGIVGDPIWETWPYLNNLWEDLYDVPDPHQILTRRVEWLAEDLEVDRARVRDWGIAGCVLSAVWSAEDGGTDWVQAISHAEMLAAIRV